MNICAACGVTSRPLTDVPAVPGRRRLLDDVPVLRVCTGRALRPRALCVERARRAHPHCHGCFAPIEPDGPLLCMTCCARLDRPDSGDGAQWATVALSPPDSTPEGRALLDALCAAASRLEPQSVFAVQTTIRIGSWPSWGGPTTATRAVAVDTRQAEALVRAVELVKEAIDAARRQGLKAGESFVRRLAAGEVSPTVVTAAYAGGGDD